MDQDKKISKADGSAVGDEKKVRTTAIDTGKRVDVSGAMLRSAMGRRPVQGRTVRKAKAEVSLPKAEKKPHIKPIEKEERAAERTELPRRIPLYVEPVEFDETGDFASMLEESLGEEMAIDLKVGDKVTGKVIHIGKDNIFISLGAKVEAAIAAEELSDEEGHPRVRMGQRITSYVLSTEGGVTLSNNIAQAGLDLSLLQDACSQKIPVEGKVLAVNKGGFDVQISGRRAFCPVGQIDDRFVADTASFVGKSLQFLIERIDDGGRNIVVSRRALLDRERRDRAMATAKELEVGKRLQAVITRIADFGAFADIGGIEGLIPRSEISHGHIDRVSDAVSSGDRVEVEVMSFELDEASPHKAKVTLSLKKTEKDPYELHWHEIKPNAILEGRVVRLESFGAFVELFPGIDGLIHISELSESRVSHPKDILSIGDPVTVRILTVDDEQRRVGLSLRESVSKKGRDAASALRVERGQKATGVVSRIERYGVFLELDSGVVALLPSSETGLPKHADLSRAFHIGDRLEVLVIDVDQQNRVRVSALAREQMDERDSYLGFQSADGEHRSLGTLADLFKKKG